ncbi:MAG: hypothetical protein HY314_15880 [Acidobacteria bacterium]|nr:hypothetical protein [Acidobacteriota bacterium]
MEAEEAQRKIEDELRREEEELEKPEEEHQRLEEEVGRDTGEEEEQRREAEGARQKAEEKASHKARELQEVEEESPRSEEERKSPDEETRRNGEEALRKAEKEERPKGKPEGKPLEPGERGGRPRDTAQDHEKQPAQETKSRHPKPEIICWKRERQWILGVEVPEELLENSGLVVLQNASSLSQDGYREGCWRLEQAFGEVVVHWNEGEDEDVRESKISLSEEHCLLFKLTGQNQNQGRRVKFPSSGSHLVVVPETWEPDEALSGSPPPPEPVSLAGYKAHFFDFEKDGDRKIAFRTPASGSLVIQSKVSRFEPVGNRLNDASENIGPLFGERPPQIRALDDQAWRDSKTVVVGEEGSGKGRWRKSFNPVPEGTEQDLPSEVAAKKGGWYFLRFYDMNDDLIESLDFRFICALREIRIPQPFPLPFEDGHRPVRVEFLHESGCAVQPINGSASSAQIEYENDKTILSIPPDPTCDETRWLVGPKGGPQVEVTILVERLWWAVGEEGNAPSEWEDQLLTLPRDDFAATSKKALWLRLPRRRWVDRVLVGFEQPKARSYTAKVMEKTVAIPLRDFGDSQKVGNRTQEHSFKVWIKRDDGLVEKVIAFIPAELLTTVRQEFPISRLNLAKISIPRLASVLAGLRRVTRGPLRLLIKEVHHEHPKGRAARRAESVEFVKKALCVIAFSLELGGEEQSQILSVKNHWIVKARCARDEFPEVMSRLRNRYEKLKTGRAHQAGSMRERRMAE